jgi:hypothetical protein
MDTKALPQSKPQWRYDRPHRVRFFTESIHINDAYDKHDNELYWEHAKNFSLTPQYAWIEANGIDLQFNIDSRAQDWHKQIRFYGDLTESQYIDYCLRFFDHQNEAWK